MEQLIIKIKDKEKYMLILSLISLTNNVFIENYYNICVRNVIITVNVFVIW